MPADAPASVEVAVRIRPQLAREKIEACRICTFVTPGEPQICIGKDKSFTFDHVYDIPTCQEEIFDGCVKKLVDGCFDGYNATVLAYGQTGSGKTYTMGTGFDVSKTAEEFGVIPRAVDHLFNGINHRILEAKDQSLPLPEFIVSAQFMELYNEEIIDLFDTTRENRKIQIHEDENKNIFAVGVTTRVVRNANELMKCLQEGALNRTTASTQMNAQSSRSHAIFTIHVKQTKAFRIQDNDAESPSSEDGKEITEDKALPNGEVNGNMNGPLEFETLTAKFHFTDLAGSERLKRTGATGDRAKEGISINCGLLALGNVISALGDPAKKSNHVPYRDSKLTRLLQDSLGGNSRTLMVACISPSDSDFMETMNALKYANRARNIKNKVSVNQDKASQQIQMYKQQIASLLLELTEYKMGKRDASNEGYSDMYQESNLLHEENEHLRMRLKAMQQTIDNLTTRISSMSAREACKNISEDDTEGGMESIVESYIKEIEELRSKVIESESMCGNLRRRSGTISAAPMSPFASRVTPMPMAGTSVFESSSLDDIPVMEMARKDIEKLKERKDELEEQAMLRKENKENIATTPTDENPPTEQPEDGDEESSDESDAELNLSESEDEENDENYQDELATLAREIDIKQKLILELEAQQRRIKSMQHQYENKLEMMETRIKSTEEERDKVLENMKSKADTGNSTKVKAEYQKKLETMKKELGKLKEAKKAHDRLQREQTKYQQQLKKFRTEMEQMKSAKVRLMKQMRENQKKVKMQETKSLREITQLKRESRKKEGLLRNLESRYQAKDRMIHRKQEEVEMLRKQVKPISGKFGQKKRQMDVNMNSYGKNTKVKKSFRKGSSEYSSKAAKSKWQNILGKITDVVTQRETISRMERQMDRLFKERERLQKTMKRYERKFNRSKVNEKGDAAEIKNEINNLQENIEFVNEQIEEIQSDIMQVEETLEVDSYISSIFSSCTFSESKYFLEQMLTFGVNKSTLALESQNRIKEMESALESEMETSKQAHEVMRYMIDDPQMTELIRESKQEDSDGSDDSSSESTSANITPSSSFDFTSTTVDRKKKDPAMKARRRTATPQELLHGITSAKLSPISDEPPTPFAASSGHLNETFTVEPVINEGKRRETFVIEKATEKKEDFAVPSSPPPNNKNVPENVFSRLTMYALSSPRTNNFDCEFSSEFDPSRGRMNPYSKSTSTPRTSALVCMQVAEGHHKSVLCVEATDHLLFSGSKDRTVKIWNLVTSQEIMSLDGHPNNVTAVRHCERTGLVFTASLCYIKVWDIRTKARCVKVLCSSGQTLSPSAFMGTMGRTNRMPDNESPINDFLLSGRSKGLYSASGTVVRIWDLDKYSVVGKMSGHTGHVMTMGLPGISNSCESVVTGSKDHYVKFYDIPSDVSGNISPSVTLEPPHMDGVEAIAISKRQKVLFTGSRDKSIKKWDLETKKSIKSEYQAHQNWVCALDVIQHGSEEILVSGGRGGILKIWDVESFGLLGDIRAHSDTINCITSNKNLIFSASSDRSVRVWRLPE